MKKMIIGLVLGMLIGSATVAFAASDLVGTKVQAVFASFNLVINGEAKVLETAPLVYNGTSYLPVRDIANLTGYDVTYKADSRTIEFNQIANTATIKPNSIKDVSAMTTTLTTEYVSLRVIAERDKLIIGNFQSFKGIKKGNVEIQIDLDNVSKLIDNPTVIQTPYGTIRFLNDGNETKVNSIDWDAVIAKMPN